MRRPVLGIRREDKNRWERRVPLTPVHVGKLIDLGVDVVIQPSPIRCFPACDFESAGARTHEDLLGCDLILAVKEVPKDLLLPGKAYAYFAHVIKGQEHNMPMLRKLLDLKCQLVEYEKMADEKGQRLVFFGRFAGLAGTIDTLWALGQRLKVEGYKTPFASVRLAHEYEDLASAKSAVGEVGGMIKAAGLPDVVTPMVFGCAGYGNVSRGAQEILDLLDPIEMKPSEWIDRANRGKLPDSPIVKVVFREEDTVELKDPAGGFGLEDFFTNPQNYRSKFDRYLPYLTVLVNAIYWHPESPRLLTKKKVAELFGPGKTPRMRVVADLSCDVEGAIECTARVTSCDAPAYVYEPATGRTVDGVAGEGPVILAVDNLPCELPREASASFGEALLPLVPALLSADWSKAWDELDLPPALKKAVIVYQGQLTPSYEYLKRFL